LQWKIIFKFLNINEKQNYYSKLKQTQSNQSNFEGEINFRGTLKNCKNITDMGNLLRLQNSAAVLIKELKK